MKIILKIITCIFVANIFFIPSICAAEDLDTNEFVASVEKEKWYQAKTANFRIIANTNKKGIKELAKKLEMFRATFFGLLSLQENEIHAPFTIILTEDKQIFMFLKGDKSGENSGFLRVKLGHNTAVSNSDSSMLDLYSQYITSKAFPRMPFWYRYGLATYMGTARFSGKTVILGEPIFVFIDNFKNEISIPTSKLIELQSFSELDTKEQQSQLVYKSWLLTHYFHGDKQRTGKMMKYLKQNASGVDPGLGFKESFGLTTTDMDKELNKYLKKKKFGYYKVKPKLGENLKNISYSVLSNDQVFSVMIDVIDYAGFDKTRLIKLHEQLIKKYPSNPRFYASLAKFAKNIVKAEEMVNKSLSLANETNYGYPSKNAAMFYTKKMKIAESEEERNEYWNLAVKNFNRAINQEHLDVEALYFAAELYYKNKKWKKALDLYTTASMYEPSNLSIRFGQLSSMMRLNDLDSAKNLLEKIKINQTVHNKKIKWYERKIECLENKSCEMK